MNSNAPGTTNQLDMQNSNPTATGRGLDISGGAMTIEEFADRYKVTTFWIALVLGAVIILLIMMMLFGYVHFGKNVVSTYTNSFVPKAMVGGVKQSNFGNSPNWFMQDGCAGYNCQVDSNSGKSLNFGVSNFGNKSNYQCQQHMVANQSEAQKRAIDDAIRRFQEENARVTPMPVSQMTPHPISRMTAQPPQMSNEEARKKEEAARQYIASRQLDEVSGRQVRTLAGCDTPWDPMAGEEAKVLGAMGVYRQATPGMSSFNRALNDNIPLTDSQLEAIMQGGEPYIVAPAGMNDADALSAQQRREQAMVPPRNFV